jgi:hypothetical protein
MADYNLNGLNPCDFQHLIQALARNQIAAGVTAFGDGKDGNQSAGEDPELQILLANVFVDLPVSDSAEAAALMEANGAQRLSVTLEGNQTIAIDITLGEETAAEACAYVIQIAYTAPP